MLKNTERIIFPEATILSALKKMDSLGVKSLLVTNKDDCFIGILSIGDIQRAILKDISLDVTVSKILRSNPKFASPEQSISEIKEQMFRYKMEFMPVVSGDGQVNQIYYWEDLFINNEEIPCTQFTLPVVIMAGGLGTRLRPLTNVFPKPLIPFGEQTIIEEIMRRFARHGSDTFYISVNYKGDLIEYYLKQQNLNYNLNYFEEDKPLGTAGSLWLLNGKINSTFFVSNCDIIINQDYSEILDYHKNNNNEITMVSSLKHYPIPYGVIEAKDNGQLISIAEKPEFTLKINSGMYILEPDLLKEIPNDKIFHITHLIEKLLAQKRKVGVFPISEKSWIDIGEWNEYIANNKLFLKEK